MKKEELFEGFSGLDDSLLKRSEKSGELIKDRGGMNKVIRYGSVAACLLVVLGAVMFLLNSNKMPGENKAPDENIVVENDANDTLIVSEIVAVGEYSAIYHKVESQESSELSEMVGSKVEETQNWYKISGHQDMKYLIFDNEADYSLWKFDSFQCESYQYNDVLRMIYNINSSADIVEVIVAPATMDNTDEGKELQDEIGTLTITDRDSIEEIYEVLSGMTCYGNGRWDMIDFGDDSPSCMLMQVRKGRYLTLVTSQGVELDALKYTGVSGMFYEYGGIAYNVLASNEKAIIEEILDIK